MYRGQENNKSNRESRIGTEKLNKKYCLVLLILTLAVCGLATLGSQSIKSWFVCVLQQLHLPFFDVIFRMADKADILIDIVLSLSAMLSSFIIFYYGVLEFKNYGISKRKVIAYTYGSWFVPLLLAINIFIDVCIVVVYYVTFYSAFYIFCCYSCFLQGCVIFICIQATSQAKCYKTILKIEGLQYSKLREIFEEKEPITSIEGSVYQGEEEHRKNLIKDHIDNILKGDETAAEKFEMVQKIMLIPFQNKVRSANNGQAEYSFVYQNASIMMIYLKTHSVEIQRMYSMFYANIYTIQYDSYCTKRQLLICISALVHTLIPEKFEGKYEFLEYIVKNIVTDRYVRNRIVFLYYESIVFLWIKEKLDFRDKTTVAEMERFFQKIECCVIKKDIKDIKDIKQNMRSIMELWFNNTTERGMKWERIDKIEELMSPYGENDFISYLYCMLYERRGTDDTAVSV